ncbi:unnamed protein product [Cylicocyclus nassatus]|uniref:Uncharacterized protein n=1 Tax=Cylicocyclus nassatus TaxID=53992 RepID=A0AA36DT19_CYLNA|nr:unnamed protein product [Cylicocyclus nassatus]
MGRKAEKYALEAIVMIGDPVTARIPNAIARQEWLVLQLPSVQWLSNDVQDLLRIVHTADWDTPVVNVRGEHLFASWRAVLNDGQRTTRPLYLFD